MTYFIRQQSARYSSSTALVAKCTFDLNPCVSVLDRVVSIDTGQVPIRDFQISANGYHGEAADACVPDISG